MNPKSQLTFHPKSVSVPFLVGETREPERAREVGTAGDGRIRANLGGTRSQVLSDWSGCVPHMPRLARIKNFLATTLISDRRPGMKARSEVLRMWCVVL